MTTVKIQTNCSASNQIVPPSNRTVQNPILQSRIKKILATTRQILVVLFCHKLFQETFGLTSTYKNIVKVIL